MKITKLIISLCISSIILFPSIGFTDPSDHKLFEVLGKIEMKGKSVKLSRSSDGEMIPSILQSFKLEEVIQKMQEGDEAIVKGYVSYEPLKTSQGIESKMYFRPVFIIESITPISLKKLGITGLKEEVTSSSKFLFHKADDYAPYSITINPEVASAITLTSAALLTNSLLGTSGSSNFTQGFNTQILLFTGVLATGVFIYRQVKGKMYYKTHQR